MAAMLAAEAGTEAEEAVATAQETRVEEAVYTEAGAAASSVASWAAGREAGALVVGTAAWAAEMAGAVQKAPPRIRQTQTSPRSLPCVLASP